MNPLNANRPAADHGPVASTLVDHGPVGSTLVDHGGLKSALQSHNHYHLPIAKPTRRTSVLAWPAWRRVAAVLPLVLALWLGVWWAGMGSSPW